MKKILFAFIVITLCSCAALNSFLGIDDKGNKAEGTPPITYLTEVIKAFGPIGILIGGAVTAGGAAYVGNKKGHNKFAAIVAGIQKVKKDMTEGEKESLVAKLKEHIPNEYHSAIKKIKDKL